METDQFESDTSSQDIRELTRAIIQLTDTLTDEQGRLLDLSDRYGRKKLLDKIDSIPSDIKICNEDRKRLDDAIINYKDTRQWYFWTLGIVFALGCLFATIMFFV